MSTTGREDGGQPSVWRSGGDKNGLLTGVTGMLKGTDGYFLTSLTSLFRFKNG